jgi:hypothetical protein
LKNGTTAGNILSWNGSAWVESTVPSLEADPIFMSYLSTDITLHDSSNVKVPTQGAVKAYADNAIKHILSDTNFFSSTNTFGVSTLDTTALFAFNNSYQYPTVLFQNKNTDVGTPAIALEIRGKEGTASLQITTGDLNVAAGRVMVSAIANDQGLVYLNSQGTAPAIEILRGTVRMSYITVASVANLNFGGTPDLDNSSIIEVTNGPAASAAVLSANKINGDVIYIVNHSGNAITIPAVMDVNPLITIANEAAATLVFTTTGWVRIQ